MPRATRSANASSGSQVRDDGGEAQRDGGIGNDRAHGVAEGGVRFVGNNAVVILPQPSHGLCCQIFDAKVDGHVFNQAPDQELHRQVIDALAFGVIGGLRAFEPRLDDHITQRQ